MAWKIVTINGQDTVRIYGRKKGFVADTTIIWTWSLSQEIWIESNNDANVDALDISLGEICVALSYSELLRLSKVTNYNYLADGYISFVHHYDKDTQKNYSVPRDTQIESMKS